MDYTLSQIPIIQAATPFDPVTGFLIIPPAAQGDSVQNDGFLSFTFANGSGAPRVVTLRARVDRENAGDTGIILNLANGDQRVVQFLAKSRFNEGGFLRLIYDNPVGLTVAVARHPRNPFKFAGKAMGYHTES